MDVRWGKAVVSVLLAVAALVLVGCGGSGSSSSSSSERTKLANNVAAQLRASHIPADLAACVTQRSRGLPIDELRALGNSGPHPDAATSRLGIGLVRACVSLGKGVSALRSLIVAAIVAKAPSTLPAAYTNCITAKANAVTPGQLSQLIASQSPAAQLAQARQFGIGIGRQCIGVPGVLHSLRAVFLAPIERALRTKHYSAAFQDCVLNKSRHAPSSLLTQAALDPASAQTLGEAFGRNAAKACIASGAKP